MTFKLTKDWWKSATGYQIYPRSFADSNGDGVGDIPGIIGKLDYLADLGIGFIWLSPVYRSPMRDNGYDISDYYDIAPEFGALDDMGRLIAEAGARNIGIVMDLVVNHSSDEHAWFQDALTGRDAAFRDYYVWRDPGPDGGPPNALKSLFGGSAWSFHEDTGQYYLHFFDPKQPDLNWQNPDLRRDIYKMMNWWLDRGIAGFRMDVIDMIGKDPDAMIGADGPDLHRFLREMHREALTGRNVVTVGETWSARLENARDYCGDNRDELSMVFQFAHISQDWDKDLGRYTTRPVNMPAVRDTLFQWQEALAEDGWNSLFWSNHDLPRAVSRFGHDGEYRVESAKALALVLHLMKGTPYIYQGEEIGMTNTRFERLADFNDIEIAGHWSELSAKGLSEGDFLAGANRNSRDHARVPMHWTAADHAGFTTGTPWIAVNPNYTEINVEAASSDPDSVLNFYKKLVDLRGSTPVLTDGTFIPVDTGNSAMWVYLRQDSEKSVLVCANMSSKEQPLQLGNTDFNGWDVILTTSEIGTQKFEQGMVLRPYQGFAATRAGTQR